MTLAERGLGPKRLDVQERAARQLVVRTVDGMEITGEFHLPLGTRPIDFLNRESVPFIAMTDVSFTLGGRTEQVDFLAVNKSYIVSFREP